MKRPNVNNVVVSQAKIVDYLLSNTHLDGRHKATFFVRFGFSVEDWRSLANALCAHALENDISKEELSRYGTRYVVDGIITTADGRQPWLRSVWFIDNHDEDQIPRFVSAYPLKRMKNDNGT